MRTWKNSIEGIRRIFDHVNHQSMRVLCSVVIVFISERKGKERPFEKNCDLFSSALCHLNGDGCGRVGVRVESSTNPSTCTFASFGLFNMANLNQGFGGKTTNSF